MKPRLFFWIALAPAPAFLSQATAQTIEVTSTGVGIGTAAPASKLDVSGSVFVTSRTVPTAGAGLETFYSGGSYLLSFDRTTSAYKSLTLDASDLEFTISGSEKMRIASNGSVGIGTNSPTAKLEVNGGWLAVKPTTSTQGFMGVSPGGSGYQGYIEWYKSGPTRLGYMGYLDLAGGDGNLGLNLENSANFIIGGGNVGIGTAYPGYKLEVSGSVRATSFIANSNTYADFVFDDDYKLTALSEVETAIKKQKHLTGIPSAAEAKERGIDVGEMQVKLLQKVEELTLYLVAHDKELKSLRAENEALRRQLSQPVKP